MCATVARWVGSGELVISARCHSRSCCSSSRPPVLSVHALASTSALRPQQAVSVNDNKELRTAPHQDSLSCGPHMPCVSLAYCRGQRMPGTWITSRLRTRKAARRRSLCARTGRQRASGACCLPQLQTPH